MAAIYILFSENLNRFYIGSCAVLALRLAEHWNKSFVDSFTAKTDDWERFFSIDNVDYSQARSIELHIKKMKSAVYIRNLKKYPEMISNLIQKYNLIR